jgi:predicted nucleic acid-binding protein
MAEYLLDANVLIAVFRGDRDLETFVEGMDATIDTTVYVELIQGAKDKHDVRRIEKALGRFNIVHFDERISKQTIDLIRTYSKSHGLLLGDAIIAASCIQHKLTLITFNARDFRFIKGLKTLVPNEVV